MTKDPVSTLMRTNEGCLGSVHLLEDVPCYCSDLHPFTDTAVTLSRLGGSRGC